MGRHVSDMHNLPNTLDVKENPPEDSKIIIIKLEKNQSLILPFKWKYYGNKIDKWKIDDLITFFAGRIF
jgi:hypothetical protein